MFVHVVLTRECVGFAGASRHLSPLHLNDKVMAPTPAPSQTSETSTAEPPPTRRITAFEQVIAITDIYLVIFGFASVLSLFRLRPVNRYFAEIVRIYIQNTFTVEKVLDKFFPPYQSNFLLPAEFRQVQASSGAIISGSTAVQFFARTRYPESDLDVYVDVDGTSYHFMRCLS